MKREWKPGDVAMVVTPRTSFPAWKRTGEDLWVDEEGVEFFYPSMHHADWNVRPLVVIDPEDREQVERLLRSLLESFGKDLSREIDREGRDVRSAQAALRSLVTPPRPKEPTGLGAVVEDEDGIRWTRVESGTTEARNPWWPAGDADLQPREYADIKVARLLSQGWSE